MAKRNFSNFQYIMMFIEAVFILPLINMISVFCPYQKIYPLSKKIGALFLIIAPNKKKTISDNLAIIFPDKKYSNKELKEISSIIAGYELRILLEMIAFSRMNFQNLLSYVRITQQDQISAFYHAQSNGVVAFSLHYGNWELLGSTLNHVGIPLACLVERQFNPWIDKYLQFLRRQLGIKVIYNEISQMKALLTYIKKGSVGLIADQTYWFDPLFIPFFNKEAAVPQGTASLALKMKSNLCCTYSRYMANGIYSIDLDMNIIPNNDSLETLSIEQLMKIVYHRYEQIIIQDVTNWYTLGTDRWALTRESLKEWKKNPDSSRF